MAFTVKILLNTTRKKRDGTYPLVYRLTKNRKVTKIPSGYNFSKADWDDQRERLKTNSKAIKNIVRFNNQLQQRKAQILDFISTLDQANTLSSTMVKEIRKMILEEFYIEKTNNVFEFIDEIIKEKLDSNKKGTALSYKNLKGKLKNTSHGRSLTFSQIDYSFLKKIETEHLKNNAKGQGGLAVYMRTLRAVFNRAIKSGIANDSSYPFKNYSIKKGSPERRSLTEKEFDTFKCLSYPLGSSLNQAQKLFLASFFLRGMNWMDMALLTIENVQGDFERITYIRHKTGKGFSIKLSESLKKILDEFSTNENSEFLFPILKTDVPEDQKYNRIKNKRRKLNLSLKIIAKECNITPFTIYAARHTYATVGKRKGVPTAVIQESLGHQTESITQTYLDSFENKVIDDYDELIMS